MRIENCTSDLASWGSVETLMKVVMLESWEQKSIIGEGFNRENGRREV